jgi:GT2 family glycosyltransferase
MTTPQIPPSDEQAGSIVGICTKDRPAQLAQCLTHLATDRTGVTVLVVDASGDDATKEVCEGANAAGLVTVIWERAERVGLARQRNQLLRGAIARGVEVVHFIDDDVYIEPGFLDALDATFADNPMLAGAGGIVVNRDTDKFRLAKRFFLLWGPRPSSILRSGRAVLGQYEGVNTSGEVDWLCGCTMSYRTSVFPATSFDERLEGWSWGEDHDFSYRAHLAGGTFAVVPAARVYHERAEEGRMEGRRLGFEITILLHEWVKELRGNGVSLPAFWWSTIGTIVLRGGIGIVRNNPTERAWATGAAQAIWSIARGRTSRPAPPLPSSHEPPAMRSQVNQTP